MAEEEPPTTTGSEPLQDSSIQFDREIKTQFPVARIKRLMQSDDEVGKVAQATPVVVAKALELFMIHIVDASCKQASAKRVKRVNMTHLHDAIMEEERFDFIRETILKCMSSSGDKK